VGERRGAVRLEAFEDEQANLLSRVRGAFVPRSGSFLLFGDWNQIELRIFAYYARESTLLEVFDLGLDVHRMSALAVFGELPDDKESDHYKWVRGVGKEIGFGILFGMGQKSLAAKLGRSEEEAGQFMEAFFSRFKRARKFVARVRETVEQRSVESSSGEGYLVNLWGRRRYIPPEKSYVGVNFLVQGSAADLMKDALDRVDRRLAREKLSARLLVPVHDELILDVPYAEAEQVIAIVNEEMSRCEKIDAPLRVDLDWSPTRWSEKRGLGCTKCGGSGKLLDVDSDVLLRAMYSGDRATVELANVRECGSCGGSGIDTADIAKVRAKKRL
jgi:DNA polymerase-1